MNTRSVIRAALLALAAAAALPGAVAAEGDRTIGERVDDVTLATKVKSALIASDEAKARRVEVEVRDGVVQLSGFAETRAEADAAVRAARGVAGVRSVTDSIQVRAPR